VEPAAAPAVAGRGCRQGQPAAAGGLGPAATYHHHLRKSGDLQKGVQAFSEGEVLFIGDEYAVPWAVDLAGRTLVAGACRSSRR
jgi:hypothetical protein